MKLSKRISVLTLSTLMASAILVGCSEKIDWEKEVNSAVNRITINNYKQLSANTEIPSVINIKGVDVEVSWTVVAGAGSVEIKEGTRTVEGEQETYKKIAITQGATPADYSVKATISQGGFTAEKTISGFVTASAWKILDTEDHGVNATGEKILSVNQMIAKPVDANDYYQVTGVIDQIEKVDYGNVWIRDVNYDESADDAEGTNLNSSRILIYGIREIKGQSSSEYKPFFGTLGCEVGDTITVIGTRAVYGSKQEIENAYYVSHTPKVWSVDEIKAAIPDVLNEAFTDEEAVDGTPNTYTASTVIDLTLPTSKTYGKGDDAKDVTITWTSSDETILSNSGEVKLPEATFDKDVTLTASVAIEGENEPTTFKYEMKVSSLPAVTTIDAIVESTASYTDTQNLAYYLVDAYVAGHDSSGRPILRDASTGKAILLYDKYSSITGAAIGTRVQVYAQAATFFGYPQLQNPTIISTTAPSGTYDHGTPVTMTADQYSAKLMENIKAHSTEYIEITGCKSIASGSYYNIETANGATIQANTNTTSAAAARKIFADNAGTDVTFTVRGYSYGNNSTEARIFVIEAELETE